MADAAIDRLLSVLDPDPVCASEKYAALRLKLLKYFEWNRAAWPEDLAHEVICRALARIHEGQPVYASNPQSYFFGVARNVLMEHWKRMPDPLPLSEAPETRMVSIEGAEQTERRLLLSECLQQLPPDDRDLIVRYYSEGSDCVRQHMGISSNALRIRIHRIKARLEQWAATGISNPNDVL